MHKPPLLDYAPSERADESVPLWYLPAILATAALGISALVLGAIGGSVAGVLWGVATLVAEYHIVWHRRHRAGWFASALAGTVSLIGVYSVLTSDGDFPPNDVVAGFVALLFGALSVAHACWAHARTTRKPGKRLHRT